MDCCAGGHNRLAMTKSSRSSRTICHREERSDEAIHRGLWTSILFEDSHLVQVTLSASGPRITGRVGLATHNLARIRLCVYFEVFPPPCPIYWAGRFVIGVRLQEQTKPMTIHHLQTEIEIAASPERVWAVLADFASYPQWNPFIKSVAGAPEQGARLQIAIQPSGGKLMRFSPVVLTAEAGRKLRWLGRLLIPGLFDGEHYFLIEPLGESKVRFQQSERFSGLLVGLLRGSLDRDTRRAFEEMNRALKARVEGEIDKAVEK